MRVIPDNAHCMRHAHSYPLDRECPECRVNRVLKEFIRISVIGHGDVPDDIRKGAVKVAKT